MTKKKGTVLKSTDEQTIEKNQRARVAVPEPPASDPLPDPDPIPLPRVRVQQPLFSEYAEERLVAESVARLARDAGTLGSRTEAEAAYLIMRGFEMGIPAFRALEGLYLAATDDGKKEVVEEASLMREQVLNSGLGVIEPLPEQCTRETASVRAIRHDRFGRREAIFTYTLADAQADGLLLKSPGWQSGTNREARLVARATAKARRAWFEDVGGARYIPDEFGAGGDGPTPPGDGLRERTPTPPPVPSPPTPTAPESPLAGAGHATPGDDAGASPPAPTPAGDAPPPGTAAAEPPPSPPPQDTSDAPPTGASKQERLAYYATLSEQMRRPWNVNAGMSRDAQPVPIITHGGTVEQLTEILNYIIRARVGFAGADDAHALVIDHLGKLGIDGALLPVPYCLFALSHEEAGIVVEGLRAFAEQQPAAEEPNGTGTVAEPPVDPRAVVQEGQAHSWVQANDYFEATVRRLVTVCTRADLLGMMATATGKTFYEMTPDELFRHAADLDRLGQNPTVFKQALERMRMEQRGG